MVVSGPAGTIQGVAPAATLVPIRCIESVVLAFNASAVARAIDYARQRNCDIITMSLGGTPSRAMRRAIDRAIADGMIVLAAAGNCVKLVVYPARYDDVIAVAGSNVNDAPWIGSCRGAAVDVTGPAENVWTAVPGSSGKRVGGGQGTSFAVAMTAGAAALWLSHHGTDKVRAEAASRGATVQRLFREFLVATARQPETWDAHDFGAGIIDVAALLKRPLTAPFLPGNESSAPGDDAMGLVLEAWGDDAAEVAAVAAEPQLQLELSALALEDARNGGGGAGGLESSIQREGISPQLAEALGRPTAIASRTPGRPLEGPMTGGAAVVIETPTEIVHAPAIGDVIAHQAREALIESVARNPGPSMGVLESNLHGVRTGSDDDAALERLHDQLLATAESVVKDMAAGRAIPDQVEQRTALEALVMVHGRPALRLADDGVDGSDPQLGEWAGPIFLHPDLTKLQRAVGRIDSGAGAHVGTGFVVGEGLVMTNRHVVEAIAFPAPRRYEPAAWVLAGSPTIDFSPRADDPSRRFKILEVVFSGPEPADRVDLSHLDLALLRIETVSTDDVEAPQPLTLSDEPVTLKAAKLFVIGYPALPTVLPKDAEGAIRQDVVRRLQEIFRLDFGVRYLSPGTVMQTPSELLPDTPNPLVFAHDATSLGGNSGSCVLAFDDKLRVSGLHFAGDWLRANFAHAMADVRGSFSSVLP